MTADIIILGAGLSGLTLAKLLQDQGKDFLVLEARDRIGGRIHTIKTDNGSQVESGATWFFPHFESLSRCLRDVEVGLKEQFMRGYTLYEYNRRQEPRRILTREDCEMLRIEGGTAQIVERLHSSLESGRVVLAERVVRIARTRAGLEVESSGGVRHCRYLVSTLPPQLLLSSLEFQPGLPDNVRAVMARTHTWMGDSVKTILTYDSPWWRRSNLSGALYSNTGPVVQMYDQSDEQGAALVGFLDEKTAELGPEERREAVVSQLVRVFGPEAGDYTEYRDTSWRSEQFTMPSPEAERLPRQNNVGHPLYQQTYMEGRLYIGGSETSTFAGGFMEGAVCSANAIANKFAKLQ